MLRVSSQPHMIVVTVVHCRITADRALAYTANPCVGHQAVSSVAGNKLRTLLCVCSLRLERWMRCLSIAPTSECRHSHSLNDRLRVPGSLLSMHLMHYPARLSRELI